MLESRVKEAGSDCFVNLEEDGGGVGGLAYSVNKVYTKNVGRVHKSQFLRSERVPIIKFGRAAFLLG